MKLLGSIALCLCAGHSWATVTYRELTNNRAGVWKAKVRYPHFQGNSALITFANRNIQAQAKKMLADFVRDVRSMGAPAGRPAMVMEFDAQGKVDLDSRDVLSIHFEGYGFTGGAHPYHFLPTSNFGIRSGKPSVLTIDDVTTNRKDVSKIVLTKVSRKPGADWVTDGELKVLSKEQWRMFVITRRGLHFLFPPYEMGPYSSGSFEVDLPWNQVLGLRSAGPIRSLVKAK